MPSHSRRHSENTTDTTTADTAGQSSQQGGENQFLASLLSGKERLDGDAAMYFRNGIKFVVGMSGKLIERMQKAIGAGADGAFGPKTLAKLKAFQLQYGLPETGEVDEATWAAVVSETSTLANLEGEEDFARMWEAHPHNYQSDSSQDTSSDDLVEELGMAEGSVSNTCALRMSTMMNRIGGDVALDTGKAREAGLDKMRQGGLYMPKVTDPKSEGKKDRVILSAKEMWTYWEKHRGPPDLVWPPRGRYKTEEEAKEGAKEVELEASSKKGFVAFDRIFGYAGTGHVDLFDGTTLSDANEWYPSQRIMLWYVADAGPLGDISS
ncbi:MAG: hypothetical protein ACI9MC_000319 [Kiritimatiellia bacterium]|jgi:hypothetical protein